MTDAERIQMLEKQKAMLAGMLVRAADLLEVMADDAPCPKDSFPEDCMNLVALIRARLK